MDAGMIKTIIFTLGGAAVGLGVSLLLGRTTGNT